ncbi:hypothetical protein HDU96_007376 [Phlyctochytrium bullatum]|nr:hypothetical protein HDU96_007376 [Phlyctochytrium bullatum]
MDILAKELEKVVKKQKSCADLTLDAIDRLIETIEKTKADLELEQPENIAQFVEARGKPIPALVKDCQNQIAESHKELYGVFSKFVKSVEKKFKVDLDNIKWDPKAIDSPDKVKILHKAIALHFIREGEFHLADTFSAEAGVEIPDSLKEQFQEMFQIVEAIRGNNLGPAIDWAEKHREQLAASGSPLEFQLKRRRFIQFLEAMQTQEALVYAKANFGSFSTAHFKEIQRLMCSVLFRSRLQKSPYSDFLEPTLWPDLQNMFTRDFCTLLGLPSQSPLYTTVTIGMSALPYIIKMSEVVKDKAELASTAQMTELPIEIPLPDSYRFHSIFTCPVSKEQSTEENPPMMMLCGHVISKESLTRMSKGNPNLRFKCPYCPTESTAAQAIRVYF